MKIAVRVALLSLRRSLQNRSEIIVSLGFLLSFSAVAVLGIGVEGLQRPETGVGLVWLSLLLTLALHSTHFMMRDEEQGVLLQMQLLPLPAGLMLFAKALGGFLGLILPLLAATPLVGIAYGLQASMLPQLALFLLLGGWCYWLLLCAAEILLLGSRRAGGLSLLWTLPLGVPVLVFGCAASLREGAEFSSAVVLLSALALALSALAPWLFGALIRQYRAGN